MTRPRFSHALIPLVCLTLMACSGGQSGAEVSNSGGSGGGGAPPPGPVTPPANPLFDQSLSNPLTLPVSGVASYSGLMSLEIEAAGNAAGVRTPYAGTLTMSADFANAGGLVTGEVRNVATGAAGPMTGVLYLTLGQIDRGASGAGPTFAGLLSGSLRENTDTYLLHGNFAGNFVGETPDAVSGTVSGQSIRSGRTSAFAGSFAAD